MIEVDSYELAALADSLGVERTALKAGDLRLTHEGETVLIERKTWDDAYGAWQSQRLEAQITKMLEADCPLSFFSSKAHLPMLGYRVELMMYPVSWPKSVASHKARIDIGSYESFLCG